MATKSRRGRERRSNPFLEFYRTEIAPAIASFEARRKKGFFIRIVTIVAIIGLTIALTIILESFLVVIGGIIVLTASAVILKRRMKNTLGAEVWDIVKPKLFQYLKVHPFDEANEIEAFSKADIGGLNFFPSLAKMNITETYKGEYKGHQIGFCGITAFEIRRGSVLEVEFEGIYLSFDLPSDFNYTSSLVITPSPDNFVRELFDFEIRGHETVTLPHPAFTQNYRIRTSNEKEITKILTPDLLDFFVNIAKATKYHARLSVNNGKLHCCIPRPTRPFKFDFGASLPDFKQLNTITSDFSVTLMMFNKILY